MRRIKIVIEYIGTRYCGWQVQPNGTSVQQNLEDAINRLTGEDVRVRGASRTDSGVHARGQVAVFDTESQIPEEKFSLAINSRLPNDIAVVDSVEVKRDFDPRRMAKQKLYRYRIHNSPIRTALDFPFVWHLKYPLDREKMIRAAKYFLGSHDFTSFSKQECNSSGANNIRDISRSELKVDGCQLIYEVEGRSFLYNMVRNIVGMLVDVGLGNFEPEDIEKIFAARSRAAAGQGAPAKGLCLEWIRYGQPNSQF